MAVENNHGNSSYSHWKPLPELPGNAHSRLSSYTLVTTRGSSISTDFERGSDGTGIDAEIDDLPGHATDSRDWHTKQPAAIYTKPVNSQTSPQRNDLPSSPSRSTTRSGACYKLLAHLPPLIITIFILLFNGIGFLNGPSIASTATLTLQMAAKLHELCIIGSLALVVTDCVTFCLVNDGINLGLLSAPFMFPVLDFLWSPELLSIFRARVRGKAVLFAFMVLICLLAGVSGPASALLFVPSSLWVNSGGSQFHLGGGQDQLWPQTLSSDHTGPQECSDLSNSAFLTCLWSGHDILRTYAASFPNGLESTENEIVVDDGGPNRFLSLNTPLQHTGDLPINDVWGYTLHGATVLHVKDLQFKRNIAFNYVSGRDRRIRDFKEGLFSKTLGKVPVARTLCGPVASTPINSTREGHIAVSFPYLTANAYWRQDGQNGPLRPVSIPSPSPANISLNTLHTQWFTPEGLGAATAAMAYTVQNTTTLLARGCTVDARWSMAQTLHVVKQFPLIHQTVLGDPPLPPGKDVVYPKPLNFLTPSPHFSPSLRATDGWLSSLSPAPNRSLTALLAPTLLSSPPLATSDKAHVYLEHLATLYFLNALSRIGWHLQTPDPSGRGPILPSLQAGFRHDDAFFRGGPVFDTPTEKHETLRIDFRAYGQGWVLHSAGQWIAVAVMGVYLAIVAGHVGVVVWRGESGGWATAGEVLGLMTGEEQGRKGLGERVRIGGGGGTSRGEKERLIRG
ncbi:hypothetical protein CAC42_4222 [Sphaceloma murrayae]|uniref:Uncharacterized protein n=1 Tax=Sphaceloma murrayae TaxID=2082308 RepID=A0A2K1QLL2_9PEZI|nr:hypothetical protein CAC42_4222 [Sphaceloma murrayae]